MERVPEIPEIPIICTRFLDNLHGEDVSKCSDIHTKYPFLWQAKVANKWSDFRELTCLEIESKYRDPQIDGIHVNFPSCVFSGAPLVPVSNSYIDFDGMTMLVENDNIGIRRLSTASTAVSAGPHSTNYVWYFEAWDNVWVRYGETLELSGGESSKITATTSDDIERQYSVDKKLSISTQCLEHIYELNFLEMTQTNKQTKVIRRIRRRVQDGPLQRGLLAPSLALPKGPKNADEINSPVASCSSSLSNSNSNFEEVVSTLILDELIKKLATTLHDLQSSDDQNNKLQQIPTGSSKISGINKKPTDHFEVNNLNIPNSYVSTSNYSHEWFFEDDDGSWKKYGVRTSSGHSFASDDVEVRYEKNPAARVKFRLSGTWYQINFSNMTQTNVSTGTVRNVRRMIAGVTPHPVAKQVLKHSYEWHFQDDDLSWVKYGSKNAEKQAITTDDVEEQYINNRAAPFSFKLKNCSYILDFTKMIQTNVSTRTSRNICRVATGSPLPSLKMPNDYASKRSNTVRNSVRLKSQIPNSCHYPSNAEAGLPLFQRRNASVLQMISPSDSQDLANSTFQLTDSSNKVYSSLPLTASHSEYHDCIKLLGSHRSRTPLQVFKISNPYFKTAFENRKAFLQKQNPGVTYREERLFHGTKNVNIQSILEENIDWRLHGTNAGQRYGRGAYFSDSAQTSCGFGSAVFICKVLVGLTCLGNASTVRPPKDGQNRAIDTTVNNVAKPSIFVKYCSEEYYPEYYLLF